MQTNSDDPTKVWAYGIKEPGWHVAKGIWSDEYAEHLKSLGYRVARAEMKPRD